MRAGALRHQLVLQEKSVSRDAYGGEVISWSTFAIVPGEAAPISGREIVQMRMADADVTTRFRIRHVVGVKPTMRVLWDSLPFNITSVIDVGGRGRELELLGYADVA